ncbi:hypothetical protein E2C01_065176 [Portunus trituberculatus]|uniref:Uncharacterized protein n=1 Tax=Portunus trituberculatus TaxID=210409 RepID=A0A5B7HR09_PORTR|nr:hypothetical protein [Portunus trituberculatus]
MFECGCRGSLWTEQPMGSKSGGRNANKDFCCVDTRSVERSLTATRPANKHSALPARPIMLIRVKKLNTFLNNVGE